MTDPRRIEALANAAFMQTALAREHRLDELAHEACLSRLEGNLDAILRECQRERETG